MKNKNKTNTSKRKAAMLSNPNVFTKLLIQPLNYQLYQFSPATFNCVKDAIDSLVKFNSILNY